MTTQEVLDMLDDMAAQTRKTNGFFAGHVTHAWVLWMINEKKKEVRERERQEQERINKLLRQAEEEAGRTEPLPTRTYTKLEDLTIGDRVKACLTTGTRIPGYLEMQTMKVLRFTKQGNVICDLGDGGKPFSIPPYMLIKIDNKEDKA
ncbi:MAG: hypothetical protein LUG62_00830 [Clostridiales bacterium]|nr:hypothetical protein [Clostridiales bacterium]